MNRRERLAEAARLADAARIAAITTRRRLAVGPRHPSWSWQYELLLDWLRVRFRRSDVPLAVTRQLLDDAGDWELRRNRVTWSSTQAGSVKAEWAIPPQPSERTILYLHGGGYAFGSIHSHRTLLASTARATHARVLGVDYRLAPEHRCPAAIDDAVEAWRWLLDQGVPPEHLVIAGDSAGGGLAIATLVALRDAGLPLPAGAVLLSPWTDLTCSGESCAHNHESDFLGTKELLFEFAAHYVGDLDRADPRVSPLYADLHGLPPLLVIAGGVELLLDDSLRFVERARAAGVDVRLHVEPDEVHVYPMFAGLTPRASEAMARIGAFVAEVASGVGARVRAAGSS